MQNISSSVDAKIEFQPETEKFKPVPIPVLQRQNSSSGEEEAIEEDEEQVEKESEDEPNPIKLLQDEALDAERKLREKQVMKQLQRSI